VNLADLLHASAARHSGRPAVTDVPSGQTLAYGELGSEAERVARFLLARGVEPGQRIGLVAPNGPGHVAAAFGLLTAGACLVPVATHLTPTEMAQLLAEVQVNGCLSWPGAPTRPAGPGRVRLSGGPCDGFAFEWIDREAEGPAPFRALDPAFIRFTSGTTDRSKGVVLSHDATAARVQAADRVLGFHQDDRILWVLPLAYHFAVTIVAYVRAGAHILICPDTLPGAMLDAIRRLRATVLYASPLHFERLGHQGHGPPLASLRLALSTSAPIAAGVMARFESAHGVPVSQAYGIIEAAPSRATRSPRSETTASGSPPGRRVRSGCGVLASSPRTTPRGRPARRSSGTAGSSAATSAESTPRAPSISRGERRPSSSWRD
jgi:long-chain acyl-CoA synthetase